MENYTRYIKSQEHFHTQYSGIYVNGDPTNNNLSPDITYSDGTQGPQRLNSEQMLKSNVDVQSVVSKYTGKIINITQPVGFVRSEDMNFLVDSSVSAGNTADTNPRGAGFSPPVYHILFNGQALTVLGDGLVGLRLADSNNENQQFELILVKDQKTFEALIDDAGNTGMGASTQSSSNTSPGPTDYPFYILRSNFTIASGNKKRCLYWLHKIQNT